MWGNVIGEHMRRANRNLLWANAALFGIIALGFASSANYWTNYVHGPIPANAETLAAIKDVRTLKQDYVTLRAENTLDSGLTEVEQRKSKYTGTVRSEHTSAHFVLAQVGKRVLIVKSAEAKPAAEMTGQLVSIPAEVQSRLVDKLDRVSPRLKSAVLPYMLDTNDYKGPGRIGLMLGLPLMALALFNLAKVWRRTQNPMAHPIVKALSAYGSPQEIAQAIDSDVAAGMRKFGNAQISRSWILQPTTYGLKVRPVEGIVWAYEKVTQHRTNGVPTGKTYAAILRDRNGDSLEISGKEDQVMACLEEITQRVPWALFGYNADTEQTWNRERATLVAAVDQRRQQATTMRQEGVCDGIVMQLA